MTSTVLKLMSLQIVGDKRNYSAITRQLRTNQKLLLNYPRSRLTKETPANPTLSPPTFKPELLMTRGLVHICTFQELTPSLSAIFIVLTTPYFQNCFYAHKGKHTVVLSPEVKVVVKLNTIHPVKSIIHS